MHVNNGVAMNDECIHVHWMLCLYWIVKLECIMKDITYISITTTQKNVVHTREWGLKCLMKIVWFNGMKRISVGFIEAKRNWFLSRWISSMICYCFCFWMRNCTSEWCHHALILNLILFMMDFSSMIWRNVSRSCRNNDERIRIQSWIEILKEYCACSWVM